MADLFLARGVVTPAIIAAICVPCFTCLIQLGMFIQIIREDRRRIEAIEDEKFPARVSAIEAIIEERIITPPHNGKAFRSGA